MTAQQTDLILINGVQRLLFSNPLEAYIEENRRDIIFLQDHPNTACWRGYVAEWEIDEGMLFLLNVEGNISYKGRGSDYNIFHDKVPATLSAIFGSVSGRVPATWYSGELRVPLGEMIEYVHAGYGSRFSTYLLISVENGACGEHKYVFDSENENSWDQEDNMNSVFNDLRTFVEQKKKSYKNKLRWMVFACVGAIVVLPALAIALSKIIPFLIIGVGSVAFAIWCFLKIRKIELTTLIQYVRDAIDKLLNLLKEKEDELRQFEGDPANFSLKEILTLANEEERSGLEKIIGTKFENAEQFDLVVRKKATAVITKIKNAYQHVTKRKGIDHVATYGDMLDRTGEEFELSRDGRKDRDFEILLVKTGFKKMVDNMKDKDRRKLEHDISKYAEEHLGKKNIDIVLTSGGLIAANIGGFATYTMASSLLAGVSSTFGVVLPFAVYTSLSSIISIALGPIGLLAIGFWGLHKINSRNIRTTILTVLAVASIRERLIFEYPEKRGELKQDIDNFSYQISELESLLVRINLADNPDAAFLAVTQNIKPEAIEHLPKIDS